MSTKELNAYLLEMRAYAKKISSDKKASEEFLQRTGVYTKKGKLSKNYRSIKGYRYENK